MSTEREIKMFGCTVADLTREVGEDRLAYAMSVLSDAQEELSMGRAERARQLMNVAKWAIMEERDVKAEVPRGQHSRACTVCDGSGEIMTIDDSGAPKFTRCKGEPKKL
jgi:hypothetical protein